MYIFRTRYSLIDAFIVLFLALSLVIRLTFTFLSWHGAALSFSDLLRIYGKGFLYDLAFALFISTLYAIYLFLLPKKLSRSLLNRILTYTGFFLVLLLCLFSFFAEVTFWNEFDSRFNFIAVDYLIYTYEVVNNLNQSYPLPLLLGAILLITSCIVCLLKAKKVFYHTFYSDTNLKTRIKVSGAILLLSCIFIGFLNNGWAEGSRYTIPDKQVHFENVWGICDEDLYDAVIRDADKKTSKPAIIL